MDKRYVTAQELVQVRNEITYQSKIIDFLLSWLRQPGVPLTLSGKHPAKELKFHAGRILPTSLKPKPLPLNGGRARHEYSHSIQD